MPPAALDAVRPHVAAEMARAAALSEGRYTAEDLWRAIADGAFGLWLVAEGEALRAVVLTELIEYPTGFRECVVWHVGGAGMREWIGLGEALAAWAKEKGCAAIGWRGRRGWQRVTGWRERAVWCERRL